GFDFFFGSFDLYQDKRNEHRLVGQELIEILYTTQVKEVNCNSKTFFAALLAIFSYIYCFWHGDE
ncbi:MAG: hypothetical protein J7K51_02025, partial [Thermotogae bacterium]|nr:hypothetical protein [Thermotogota bacterium]